jgi:hypothetical protein
MSVIFEVFRIDQEEELNFLVQPVAKVAGVCVGIPSCLDACGPCQKTEHGFARSPRSVINQAPVGTLANKDRDAWTTPAPTRRGFLLNQRLSVVHAAASTLHFKFHLFGNVRYLEPFQPVDRVEVSVGQQALPEGPFDSVARACDLHGHGGSVPYLHRHSPIWNASIPGSG